MAQINPWDEPLFGSGPPLERHHHDEEPKDVILPYNGRSTTCHVCAIYVATGRQLLFPRQPAASELTEAAGRKWLLCTHHRHDYQQGMLALPTERENQ